MAWIKMAGGSNSKADLSIDTSVITSSRGTNGGTGSTIRYPGEMLPTGKYLYIVSMLANSYSKAAYWGANNTELLTSLTWGTGATVTVLGQIQNSKYPDQLAYSSCNLQTYIYLVETTSPVLPYFTEQQKGYYGGGNHIYVNVIKLDDDAVAEYYNMSDGVAYSDTQTDTINANSALSLNKAGDYIVVVQCNLGGQTSSSNKRTGTNIVNDCNISSDGGVSVKNVLYDSSNFKDDYSSTWLKILHVKNSSSGNIVLNSDATSQYKPELRLGVLAVALSDLAIDKVEIVTVSTTQSSTSVQTIKVSRYSGDILVGSFECHTQAEQIVPYVDGNVSINYSGGWKLSNALPCTYNGTSYAAGALSLSWAGNTSVDYILTFDT